MSVGHLPCTTGSSPHTRGALVAPHRRHDRGGIIPAYAGSTRRGASPDLNGTDHPRIRGEHPSSEFETYHDGGSSPHTRGALAKDPVTAITARIIPAYAGSTAAHGFAARGRRGSSPHTRGARAYRGAKVPANGIIPAYAGSTALCPCRQWRNSDHPRIRGEHRRQRRLHDEIPGSSPHTRGARPDGRRRAGAPRIIPAYAGSTLESFGSRTLT